LKKEVPYVFIGSSGEKLKHAEALQVELGNRKILTRNWGQKGIFIYGNSNLESLYTMSQQIDFACFILDNDDVKTSRSEEYQVIRDNVLFEIGLCIGSLGRDKVFIIYDRDNEPVMPSDLDDITMLSYEVLNNDLSASLGVTALSILQEIDKIEDNKDISSDEGCSADWIISYKDASHVNSIEINNTTDTSDLFFLFLSVEDCKKSRLYITDILTKFEKDYNIEAIYDLLGTWDIVIKYRTGEDAMVFKNSIIETLQEEHQMNKDENQKFSKSLLVDIKRQSATINGLLKPKKNEKIVYTILPKSEDYNTFRASRAFLYIEAKAKFGEKNRHNFLKALSDDIKKLNGNKIIESFCEGENELIIEIFSSCSQAAFINHLNKSIENVISTYKLDKTNLICYYYDEDGLKKYLNNKS